MNLYYISPRDVRKNRADAVHMMKSCYAFSNLGIDVTLVTYRVFRKDWKVAREDVWKLYGMDESFKIIELPTIITEEYIFDRYLLDRVQRLFWFTLFYLPLWLKTFKSSKETVIYSKCYLGILPAILLRKLLRLRWSIIFEKPDFIAQKKIHKYICKNVDGIVAINSFIAEKLVEKYGISQEKVEVHGFYSLRDDFLKLAISKSGARKKVNLPDDKYIIMYTGKLGKEMLEPKYIMEAAEQCPDKLFVLVGAREPVKESFESFLHQRNIQNVVIRGFQPLEEIFYYVQAGDVLLSYYDNNDFSAYQRVPAKLGVYVCANRPIILADLPGLRYYLNDEQVYFVQPDSPRELAKVINYVAEHNEEAQGKAKKLNVFSERNDLLEYGRRIIRFVDRVRKDDNTKSIYMGGK